MSAYLLDWLSLLGRWVHLITGIAWIGASFYFVWLDNHLLPPADPGAAGKGVGGELWAVHGGGFYNAQKYRVAPQVLPATLHWFYWEAYSTFLSGLFLLILLYYAQAPIYLIDPKVAALSQPAAIALGVGFIVGGWLIYDALCRSALERSGTALAAVLALLLCTAALVLCRLFSGRGAFIEFGAMMGTIMVANVFFVIIPGQRAMVQAKRDGRDPDPLAGLRGKQRSVHNTYFTLPVLFTMISNHYALTFAARYNGVVLIALCAAGVLIRAYFVMRHKSHERGGKTAAWPALLGLSIVAAAAAALAPKPTPPGKTLTGINPAAGAGVGAGSGNSAVGAGAGAGASSGNGAAGAGAGAGAGRGAGAGEGNAAAAATPDFAAVQRIVAARCAPCHAEVPTQAGIAAAPKGIMLDSTAGLLSNLTLIEPQVATGAMPIGNLTGMTDTERAELLDWIRDGAPH